MTQSIVEYLQATAPRLATQLTHERLDRMVQLVNMRNEIERLRMALLKISEGRGTFSLDNYEFACNTIDEMKALAVDALKTNALQDEVTP